MDRLIKTAREQVKRLQPTKKYNAISERNSPETLKQQEMHP